MCYTAMTENRAQKDKQQGEECPFALWGTGPSHRDRKGSWDGLPLAREDPLHQAWCWAVFRGM